MSLFVIYTQSVVIDDASAARVQKLLLIVTLVSSFPLIIVGLGAIMLVVFIILLFRARKQKVWQHFLPDFILTVYCLLALSQK